MSGTDEASNGLDWLVDLGGPVRQPMRDPRLDTARAALIQMQPHLITLKTAGEQVEAVIRDCAEAGMTSDEIAGQISLTMEVVKRVLDGGSLLGLDYD